MKKTLFLILVILLFSGCSHGGLVDIKYRDDDVNLSNSAFEYLNTSRSSFVNGAWYDDDNQYMIIRLDDTYYHYCGLPSGVWEDFEKAQSFGSEYNKEITGRYDCRDAYVPIY